MDTAALLGTTAAAATWLVFAVLTGIGEAKRTDKPGVVVVAGLLFPVTWVAWYLRDSR